MANSSRRAFLAATGLGAAALGRAAGTACPKFTYATLGRTGLKVTRVGFGCMVTSDASVVERAADIGITYFDTARVYAGGNNERMVGAALKNYRKNIVLSTKAKERTQKAALETLDTSLKELGTDYVDIWYTHNVVNPEEINDEVFALQQKAKEAGKIRFKGISLHTNHKTLIPIIIRSKQFDVMLVTYNFAVDPEIEKLIIQAHEAGIGTVAMKVMAGSFKLPGIDPSFRERIQKPGAPLAALKWTIRGPAIDTTVPSIRDMDQLDEDLRAMSEPYGAADEKVLAAQLDGIRPLYCQMCGTCNNTCARGLPVSDIIRYVSYAEGYGEFNLGRENFLALTAEQQAVRCGDCDRCSVHCPNGVQVRGRVSRAQELFA